MKYAIAMGNLLSGHEFIGPFDSPAELHDFIEAGNIDGSEDWYFVILEEPVWKYNPNEDWVLTESMSNDTNVLEAKDEK